MISTILSIPDILPLTCTRSGTCCHGKMVYLNPWELHCLARDKQISTKEFRDTYCEDGGIRLRFNGNPGWKGQQACSQYVEGYGCSVHIGRPLSCRLYPLGRQIQNEKVHYIFQGKEFPCLEGCPEVMELVHMSVGEYLNGQLTEKFEKAQDEYLEIMQNIADIAFVLFIDSGLAASGEKETLKLWKKLGADHPEVLATRIGEKWLNYLTLPEIIENTDDPILFARKHNQQLQEKAQEEFGNLRTQQEYHEASVLMMGLALHMARSIGADPEALSLHWVETAVKHGASE